MPLCKIFLLTRSHMPANQHQFLDDIFIFVSSKNWCMLAGKWLHVSKKIQQSGIFFIIFMLYFNILGSIGLVHLVEPIAQFGCSVYKAIRLVSSHIQIYLIKLVRFFSHHTLFAFYGRGRQRHSQAEVCFFPFLILCYVCYRYMCVCIMYLYVESPI